MVLDRRSVLQLAGTGATISLAGCTSISEFGGAQQHEYELDIDRIEQSLIKYTCYEPGDDLVFGQPAREALDAILPDGRYTTYGYESLPEDAYIEHNGRYYQTEIVVTGRKQLERPLVRATSVPEGNVPETAVAVDSLPQASARVVKILHSHAMTNGESGVSDLLCEDAYVLRRPAELDGPLVTDLDGVVVMMDEDGRLAYRLEVSRMKFDEPAYTALGIEVANTTTAFREVVFATRVDTELTQDDLTSEARTVLDRTIGQDVYRETTPLSDGYEGLLKALGVADDTTAKNGLLLWYNGQPYRYGLYVNPVD